jgi:hypothetical protein
MLFRIAVVGLGDLCSVKFLKRRILGHIFPSNDDGHEIALAPSLVALKRLGSPRDDDDD